MLIYTTDDGKDLAGLKSPEALAAAVPPVVPHGLSSQTVEQAGLWSELQPHAAALQVMRIVDAGGQDAEPRVVRDFDASDISEGPFGWNFPNWLLRRALVHRLQTLEVQ